MKRQLNYDLLLFHVREAMGELDTLFLRIKKMLGELEKPLSEVDKAILHVHDRPLDESGLKVSLEHAYHHLNFAWNVRCKDTKDADKHFDRDEKFPKAFARFWPKSMRIKTKRWTGARANCQKASTTSFTTGSSALLSMASSCPARMNMSLNATSAGEMGRECDGLSPAESAEDAEEAEVVL